MYRELAEEFREAGVAFNALWPRTAIDTAAVEVFAPGLNARCRTPEIVAAAAHWILTQDSRAVTGHFFVDEEVLRAAGVTDFSPYRHPGAREEDLLPDSFL